MSGERKKKVCIVVLGDIGRSPRMQYHGLSFLKEGYAVQFVGYSGSEPLAKLKNSKDVKFNYIIDCPNFKNYLPTILAYGLKVFWQVLTLFIALLWTSFPDAVLVQNPPSIPTLGVCYVYCKIIRSKFVIDWHNYAYSLLALSLPPGHKLVKYSRQFEFYFGRKADKNICVTKAMKNDLETNYNIASVVFYDRPPEFFKIPTFEAKHNVLLKLGFEHEVFVKDCKPGETVFAEVNQYSEIVLREKRPALLISSTSWTEDENFYTLLNALEEYDKNTEKFNLPKLICAITGKGPLKEFYCKIIENKRWKNVEVVTPWLEPEDYPVFIGCADLGVCLHLSSSGLDLPMKVLDMFGCCVPVCAVDFNCISELVKHEENGFIFKTEDELFEQIKLWLTGFPNHQTQLHKTLRENLKTFSSLRWHDNWKFNLKPLF